MKQAHEQCVLCACVLLPQSGYLTDIPNNMCNDCRRALVDLHLLAQNGDHDAIQILRDLLTRRQEKLFQKDALVKYAQQMWGV